MSTSTLMAVAFTVPAALIAAGLILYPYVLAQRHLTEEGINYGLIVTEPILSASQRFLREGAIGAVQEMIEDTGSSRTIEHLALIGGDGKVIASNRHDWIGRDESVIDEPDFNDVAAVARTTLQPQHRLEQGGRRLILVSPLLFEGSSPILSKQDRGVLYLKLNHERRLRELKLAILKRGALSALGLLSFSMFLLLWVRTTLTRPILEVATFLRAFAKGEGGAPPRVRGPLEMAQLIDDVGRMVSDLRAKQAALAASEEQLSQAQRMEGVASLAGAMAHDFNNLLTGILGYARLLLDRVGPGDPIRRQLAAIENSAARAADLTGQLLTFSRRTASRLEPADLGEALTETIETVRSGLPAIINLTVRHPEGLWTTAIDAPQIQRALLALCANAREAMPYGGRISIELANATLSPEECRGRLEARAGRFVSISVADTGRGLDPEVRRRLFEPFVTTKKTAGGAGLGLAMAYGLIKGHKGWIEASNEPAAGARFTVYLPTTDAKPAAAAPAAMRQPAPAFSSRAAAPDAPAGIQPADRPPVPFQPAAAAVPAVPVSAGPQATILAVDDESIVLALAKDVLEMHGYRVLTARNGEEALRVFREHQSAIDLVLLDLTMPVMGGLECFREMRRLDPSVRVVICSGFSSESSASEVLREGAIEFLAKPYDIDTLARAVGKALTSAPHAAA